MRELLFGRLRRFFFALDADDFFRLFERLFYPILVLFYVDEVAVDLVYRLYDGERVVLLR